MSIEKIERKQNIFFKVEKQTQKIPRRPFRTSGYFALAEKLFPQVSVFRDR